MSLKAIIWVMEDAPVENHGELAVLYALADRANDDGTAAYPSQEWISHRARCADRTVRRHLKKLEEREVIRRGDQSLVSHYPVNRRPIVWNLNYRAVRPDNRWPDNISGRTIHAVRPDNPDTLAGQSEQLGRTGVSDKPSYKPSYKPSNNRPWETLRNWAPTDEQRRKLEEKHGGKDIDSELEKFRDWHIEKKSQYKDWNRAFDNWLKRARPSRQQLPEVDYVAAYGLEDAPF